MCLVRTTYKLVHYWCCWINCTVLLLALPFWLAVILILTKVLINLSTYHIGICRVDSLESNSHPMALGQKSTTEEWSTGRKDSVGQKESGRITGERRTGRQWGCVKYFTTECIRVIIMYKRGFVAKNGYWRSCEGR